MFHSPSCFPLIINTKKPRHQQLLISHVQPHIMAETAPFTHPPKSQRVQNPQRRPGARDRDLQAQCSIFQAEETRPSLSSPSSTSSENKGEWSSGSARNNRSARTIQTNRVTDEREAKRSTLLIIAIYVAVLVLFWCICAEWITFEELESETEDMHSSRITMAMCNSCRE